MLQIDLGFRPEVDVSEVPLAKPAVIPRTDDHTRGCPGLLGSCVCLHQFNGEPSSRCSDRTNR